MGWKHIHYIALWMIAIYLQSLITRRPQVQVLSPQPCLTADFVRNQRFFVFFRALRKPPGRRLQKWKVVWKGSGIKKTHDVKVHFLIPEMEIVSSALRAAGEKRQGDIKAILLSGGCINTYITFDFNSSSEVTSKTRLSSMRRLF